MIASKWSYAEFMSVCVSLCSSNWFPVHRSFVLKFGDSCALALQYLINYHMRVSKSKTYVWDEGWFYCSVGKFEEEMGHSRNKQNRVMNRLIDCGVLELTQKGRFRNRHFRVNMCAVQSIIDGFDVVDDHEEELTKGDSAPVTKGDSAPVTKGDSAPRHALLCNAKDKRKRVNKLSRKPKKLLEETKDHNLDGFTAKWTNEVFRVIREYDTTSSYNKPGKTSISNGIRDLVLKCAVSKEKVSDVLCWYCDIEHYKDPYTPKLHKGKDLREYFKRIEEAKQRFEDGAGHDEKKEYFDTVTKVWFQRSFIDKLRSDCTREYGIERSITQDMLDVVLEKQELTKGHISAEAVAVG